MDSYTSGLPYLDSLQPLICACAGQAAHADDASIMERMGTTRTSMAITRPSSRGRKSDQTLLLLTIGQRSLSQHPSR